MKSQKYAFLDRDGTLIFEPQDTYQIDSIDILKILDGVIDGLILLQKQGYKLIMISNQDGLGTKSFPTEDFLAPQNEMLKTFSDNNIYFEQIFICPHLPSENCKCRKPKTGLLDDWLKSASINLNRSFVCGDRDSDKGLAINLGIKFVPMITNSNFFEALKKQIK